MKKSLAAVIILLVLTPYAHASLGSIDCTASATLAKKQGGFAKYEVVDLSELKGSYDILSYAQALNFHIGGEGFKKSLDFDWDVAAGDLIITKGTKYNVNYAVESIQMEQEDVERFGASSHNKVYSGGRHVRVDLTVNGTSGNAEAVVLNGGTIATSVFVSKPGLLGPRLTGVRLECTVRNQ